VLNVALEKACNGVMIFKDTQSHTIAAVG